MIETSKFYVEVCLFISSIVHPFGKDEGGVGVGGGG